MKPGKPLSPSELYRHCDQSIFSFESTAELEKLDAIPGQERAVEAIQFGIESEPDGFNLFVLGPLAPAATILSGRFSNRKPHRNRVPTTGATSIISKTLRNRGRCACPPAWEMALEKIWNSS